MVHHDGAVVENWVSGPDDPVVYVLFASFFSAIRGWTQIIGPTQMTASTSKSSKSENKSTKNTGSKKGKAKENKPEPSPDSIHPNSPDDDLWEHATPWNWTSLTDPSSSRLPPLFTKDGRCEVSDFKMNLVSKFYDLSYFFSLVGSSANVHSTATGTIVSTLTSPPSTEQKGASDVLTSVTLNPHNPFQLITGGLDGRLLIWDYVNATLLQSISVGQPIHLLCMHEQFKGYVFVAASRLGIKAASGKGFCICKCDRESD